MVQIAATVELSDTLNQNEQIF